MALDPLLQDNLDNWNDRVPIHLLGYGLDAFDDPSHISSVVARDVEALGDLTGQRVAHLQCHIGTDSVSLARLGATVTGLDFSQPAIEAAAALAERTGADATFVCSPVYDAVGALGCTYDLVYTTTGVLNWLDDLDQWAGAVAGLLVSGGRLYVRDMHPFLWVFEEVDGEIKPTHRYRTPRDEPFVIDEAQTYVAGDTSGITHTRNNEWSHTIGEIINALVTNGLSITRFDEHELIDWQCFPSAVAVGEEWLLPEPLRQMVPTMFSLMATKP
ncbi:MAG: methyltransferase [Acidimicrobiales bacterium]